MKRQLKSGSVLSEASDFMEICIKRCYVSFNTTLRNNGILMVSLLALFACILCTGADAAPLPNGDTQVKEMDSLTVKMGLQHRVMWNRSTIPLSGVTTAADAESYDFFRQRVRFNLDIQPTDKVGGFLQLEYRGGWGGSSPGSSDPRSIGLTLNNYNRLQARGVRYGYIYYTPAATSCLAVGILPVSDRLGDILFSADWDFNVGGISYNGAVNTTKYRVAYVRLIDGVASSSSDVVGENTSLYIADVDLPEIAGFQFGAHVYYMNAPEDIALEAGLPGKVSQGWYALSGSKQFDPLKLNAFVCLNNGSFGNYDNTGFALKTEAIIPVGTPTISVMGVYSSGDKEGDAPESQFRTIQGIGGTEGYWAYSHIFTANGPSDVNDFGVGIDNGGRGLLSIQGRCVSPLTDKLEGELFCGWFNASAENAAGDTDMGSEIGGMLTCKMAQYLDLQLGVAMAFLGDYYKSNGQSPDNIHEIFSRFQLQF